MAEKIKKLEDYLLSKAKKNNLKGGKNCYDGDCTVGTDITTPIIEEPKDKPKDCGWCNCNACWGEESQWFASGLQVATNLGG